MLQCKRVLQTRNSYVHFKTRSCLKIPYFYSHPYLIMASIPLGSAMRDFHKLMMQPSRLELFYLTVSFQKYIIFNEVPGFACLLAATKPLATWRNFIFIVRGNALRIAIEKNWWRKIMQPCTLYFETFCDDTNEAFKYYSQPDRQKTRTIFYIIIKLSE